MLIKCIVDTISPYKNQFYSNLSNYSRKQSSLDLLLQHMLLFFADERHLALLGVLAHIGLLDLFLLLDRAHLFLCIEHVTRNLAMASNSLDLRMSGILLLQCLLVIEVDPLTRTNDAQFFGCICLPHAHVHLIGAGEDVSIIQRPGHTHHMLHTFGVVDVPRVAMVGIVEPDSLVIAS